VNEFKKRDPDQFSPDEPLPGAPPDHQAPDAGAGRQDRVDVVEGEVGSASLKEPIEVEAEQQARDEPAGQGA
jgi:hypothetical protein